MIKCLFQLMVLPLWCTLVYCCDPRCYCYSKLSNCGHNTVTQSIDSIPTDFPSNTNAIYLYNQLLTNLSSLDCNLYPNITQINVYNNLIDEVEYTDFLGCSLLVSLQLQNNEISEIKNTTFGEIPSLRQLYINQNSISKIQTGCFAGLTGLHVLQLQYNNITEIKNTTLSGLTTLRQLYLDGNKITVIQEGAFNGLNTLNRLSIRSNQLTVIENRTFHGMHNLNYLNLNDNQLIDIPSGLFNGLAKLNTLYLNGNDLKEIPNGLLNMLLQLTTLSLNNNAMKDISNGTFDNLPRLRRLYLDDNMISNLSFVKFLSSPVTTISLNNNSINGIVIGTFDNLPRLGSLNLRSNSLTEIRNGIFDTLKALYWLDLSDNKISHIDDEAFFRSSSLSYIYLRNNSLTGIRNGMFDNLTRLYLLDVSGNMISDINDGAFIHCSSLWSLNIGFNPITELEENAFIGLPNLRTLDLSGTKLTVIKRRTFQHVTGLHTLNIGFNPITELDENAFIDLTNLRTLDLSGTELTVINRRIFQHVTSLQTLFLKNMTSMTTLDGSVFEQLSLLSYLDLSGTSLMCDCGLYKFAEWLNKTTNQYYWAFPGPVGAKQNQNRYVYYIIESCRDSEFNVTDYPYECPNVPSVNSILAEGPIYPIPNTNPTPSLVPVFRCSFDDKWTGKYNYDVKWEIDEDEIKTYLNVSLMNINTTFLRDSDWTDTHTMNMVVRCGIRVNDSEHDNQFIFSSDFRAGIFADQSEYIVVEGESINISLTATVPIGCIASNDEIRSKCFQDFHIFQPSFDKSVLQCSNLYGSRNIVFKNEVCGIRMTDSGKNVKNLEVYGFSDGLYNYRDRSTYISMYTTSVSTPNAVWQNFNIRDIKVTVKDGDALVKNRCCRSYNDPHITTFDGKTYHYHEVGEFVMYRNDKGPYWVHALFTNCNDRSPGAACHCGVAIRSRNSLFVLRTCQTISRSKRYGLKTPLVYLKQCDSSDMFIQPLSITKYKVTLPIGTEIIITFQRLFISSIIIKPSYHDINMAKGLCGFPSTTKDATDDFMHRYYGVVQNQRTFADSWRINDTMVNEQLFFQIPIFLTENFKVPGINQTPPLTLDHFCVCGKKETNPLSLDDLNTAQCQLTSTTDYCVVSSATIDSRLPTESLNCLASGRIRKRSVNSKSFNRRSIESDDGLEFHPLAYDDDVYSENITAPAAFKNSWTEENATNTCRESIQNALPSHIYSEYVELSEDEFVESCVLDIMATGDTTYIVDTIDAMATIILVELSRNEYIHIKNMTEGNQTVLDYITGFLCPNNCNDNGNCVSGVCDCHEGYMGDSCAEQISSPPSDTSLPNDGLCSIITHLCRTTNVYGNFQSTTVWYKKRSYKITENGTVYTSGNETATAEYRHLFMVTVPLKISRRKRSTESMHSPEGYEISLSNDGSNFGESFNMIVYDENCFTCNSTSVTCVALERCKQSNKDDNNKIYVTIGVTLGVVLGIILIVLVVIIYRVKHKKSLKRINAEKEEKNGRQSMFEKLENHADDNRSRTPVELFKVK
ncbi:uncharacterized protein [Mytilus edulis]|uniref:uncharacterized protein isoform X3 n=1 Tax=Mytilus edulis TaxID=6550 RepID=UPI0039EE5441